MNRDLLRQHIEMYKQKLAESPENAREDFLARQERRDYYQSWTRERIAEMSGEEFHDYVAKLWAMRIWGNKHYVTDKLLDNNGLENLRTELGEVVWGSSDIADRWDRFRKNVKGMGPAMISEILAHTHPDRCMIWNRRALIGFQNIGVTELPRYDYQVSGKRYVELCKISAEIAEELQKAGFEQADVLAADYFIWEELQGEGSLAMAVKTPAEDVPAEVASVDDKTSDFIHDEVRDKVAEIGNFLGLQGRSEVKVADGSKVDAVWEQIIGNMGRVIYVFEVQTKGSIDSLVINLLKSLNNPAVQGVVAVSDAEQLEKIKKHAAGVHALHGKLKCWDYKKVLEVHEQLQWVNDEINGLGLVPDGF